MPLTLETRAAAEYCGCKNAAQFRREVKAGIWPGPAITTSRPQRWLTADLDQSLRSEANRATIDDYSIEIDKALGLA